MSSLHLLMHFTSLLLLLSSVTREMLRKYVHSWLRLDFKLKVKHTRERDAERGGRREGAEERVARQTTGEARRGETRRDMAIRGEARRAECLMKTN